jgi:hypothetical protein
MSDDTQARIRAAADKFGAAISDVLRLSWRQACARQIADEFGPGPWILHEDGSVEPLSPDQEGEPA